MSNEGDIHSWAPAEIFVGGGGQAQKVPLPSGLKRPPQVAKWPHIKKNAALKEKKVVKRPPI